MDKEHNCRPSNMVFKGGDINMSPQYRAQVLLHRMTMKDKDKCKV